MKLLLKALSLKNFKGIKQFEMMFDGTEVRVYGANGTGKTTLADSFMWLLFDKDSQDRKDFEIKTLDKNNQPIHHLDHEVYGVFEIDGGTIKLGKKLNEKWVKKRGQDQQEFSGHETTYYIDDIPVKKSEYQKYVDQIINEKTFKLLTNPFSFEGMKWQDKRKILFEVCGSISDDMVPGYEKLQEHLSGKDIDSFKKSIVASKKKIKQDIENIPPRIDELKRGLDELIDKNSVVVEIEEKRALIQKLTEQLEVSQEQFNLVRKLQQELLGLERNKEELIRNHNANAYGEVNRLKQELEQLEFVLRNKEIEQEKLVRLSEIKEKDNELLNKQVAECREEWTRVAEETFDEHKAICPTCGQDLPNDKVDGLIKKYESEKIVRLERIVTMANSKKATIEHNNKELSSYIAKIDELKDEIPDTQMKIRQIKEKIDTPLEVVAIDTTEIDMKIAELKGKLNNFNQIDNSTIKERIKAIEADIAIKNLKLAKAEEQEKTLRRIDELEIQLKDNQCRLADLENQEILVEDFTKAKVDMLEENINSKFKSVRFKLFDEQINGGLVECCESLIDGVPFSGANNAAKVAAGIDIINVLSEHYGFHAPIWLDNRESVTSIPDTQSQIINLIVSENDKELRAE